MLFKLKECLFKFRLRSKSNSIGWTAFAPLKVEPEYINIDLEKKQVTGIVKYNHHVYLTVSVDVQNNKTKVKGSLRGITKLTKPFTKKHYIEMIKSEAEFLIENSTSH